MIVLGSLKAEKRIQAEYPHVEENTKHFAEIAKHLSKLGSVMLLDCMTEKDIEEYVYKNTKRWWKKNSLTEVPSKRSKMLLWVYFPLKHNKTATPKD